ncbi:MAG: hypothetical protein K0R45_2455, partial [Pseudomonas sp.]|nr:hypothetical protein [Pseudomonas sp.]
AGTQNAFATGGGQIMRIAHSRVVAMTVSDYRSLHQSPRVNVEITGWAIQTFGPSNDKVHGTTIWMGLLAMSRSVAGSSGEFSSAAGRSFPLMQEGPVHAYLPGVRVRRCLP